MKLITHLHILSKLGMHGDLFPSPIYVFMAKCLGRRESVCLPLTFTRCPEMEGHWKKKAINLYYTETGALNPRAGIWILSQWFYLVMVLVSKKKYVLLELFVLKYSVKRNI
jgi:hypothetical protein